MRHSTPLAGGAALALVCFLAACRTAPAPPAQPAPTLPPAAAPQPTAPPAPAHRVIPAPASFALDSGPAFTITQATTIAVDSLPRAGSASEAGRLGEALAAILRPPTGFALPVRATSGPVPPGGIALRIGGPDSLGDEGYLLTVTRDSVQIAAGRPAGAFRGIQTLRQLLPPGIEAEQSALRAGEWTIPALRIADRPRFAWRGAMLDAARHFFTVDEVKQYVDVLALYKLNVLHLHLADDQGWRIEIRSRPRLAQLGGATEVGGGPGGYYTQRDYAEIVRYAQERYVTIVPEIDMPGHTNAMLVAHPEVSCSKAPPDQPAATAPAPYTGIHVGWSALCPDREETYRLVDDVVRELAALTPGPYLHIGGDEVAVLSHDAYAGFIERVQDIVARHGKQMVGWEEIGRARLRPTTLAQHWRSDSAAAAALQYGAKVILSPGKRVYLDMKYSAATELGLRWAGFVEVRDAYDWDPATYLHGVAERDIAGVEAPLWSETAQNITAAQYLIMPRLPAVAELAWTPQPARGWEAFRHRLAAHAPRWHFMGVNYYRSPQVPW